MKKKLFIWALLLCLLAAVLPMAAMAANQPTFSASNASGCVGSTVDVTFTIQNNTAPGLVGAELKGTYDTSKLEFVSAKNGSVMSSPICNTKDGNIYFSWDDSLTTGIVGDGVMCTLTFKIKDTCKPGDKIGIQLTQFKAHDTDLNDVTVTVTGGAVTVSDHTWETPTYSWSSDNKTCTVTRKQSCGCGGTETETATASVKEEAKQTTYTATFKNAAFATQTKTVAAGPVKVTFRLIGATISQKGVDLSNGGTSDSEYMTWIPTTAYTMEAGSSAYDLIKKALDEAGLKYTMTSSYLSSVHAPAVLDGYELAEFTNGSRSGWMFTVNGKHGSLSIGNQVLKDGDAVIVHYVNDYLYEESEFPWLAAADTEPTAPHKHNYSKKVTAPTCTKDGYTTYTCSCGDSYTDDETKAIGHSYGNWYETKAPTATKGGEEKRECVRCGHFETRTTDPVPTEPTVTEPTVTEPPVTEPPVTEPPVTEPPVTEPPVTEPPVTEPPVTEPPVTEPPVTEPPVTEPPVTEPPVTEPPVTEPPVTVPPVTEPPVTEPPVTEPPITEPPVTEPPITEPPVTEPTATDPTAPDADQGKTDAKDCTCWCCRFWWLLFLMGIAVNCAVIWGVPPLLRKLKNKK